MDKLTNKYKLLLEESEIFDIVEVKTILFLQLKRNCSLEESQQELREIEPLLKNDLIDSVTFLDTPNKFRIKE